MKANNHLKGMALDTLTLEECHNCHMTIGDPNMVDRSER